MSERDESDYTEHETQQLTLLDQLERIHLLCDTLLHARHNPDIAYMNPASQKSFAYVASSEFEPHDTVKNPLISQVSDEDDNTFAIEMQANFTLRTLLDFLGTAPPEVLSLFMEDGKFDFHHAVARASSFYKGASIDEAGQMGDYITIELYGGKLDNFWVSRVAIRDQDIKRSLMVIGRSDMIQFGIAGTEPNMNELFEECASIMGRGSKLVDLVRGKFHDEVELDTVLLEVAASAHDFVPDTILLPLLQKVRAAALHAREHKQVVDWPATEDDVAPFLEALGALA